MNYRSIKPKKAEHPKIPRFKNLFEKGISSANAPFGIALVPNMRNWVQLPGTLTIINSSSLVNSAGTPPFQHHLNGVEQASSVFQNLEPDAYHVRTTDAQGCIWDSIVNIPLNTPQTGAFTPNPTTGETPLNVYFSNQSTNATGYEWLIDGFPFSTSFNTAYTFEDSGYFEVSLVAWFDIPSCADTATYLTCRPGHQSGHAQYHHTKWRWTK